jgi:hypothetical protein
MSHTVSRRHLLATLAAFAAFDARAALSAPKGAPDIDEPFLGSTAQGDLILSLSKSHVAAQLPEKPDYFGIVRKTNVLAGEGNLGKIKMLALYAAFRTGDCQISLCNMKTLEGSTNISARRAYEALNAIARKLKKRPDAVYEVQDIDKLPAIACGRNGSPPSIIVERRSLFVVG